MGLPRRPTATHLWRIAMVSPTNGSRIPGATPPFMPAREKNLGPGEVTPINQPDALVSIPPTARSTSKFFSSILAGYQMHDPQHRTKKHALIGSLDEDFLLNPPSQLSVDPHLLSEAKPNSARIRLRPVSDLRTHSFWSSPTQSIITKCSGQIPGCLQIWGL